MGKVDCQAIADRIAVNYPLAASDVLPLVVALDGDEQRAREMLSRSPGMARQQVSVIADLIRWGKDVRVSEAAVADAVAAMNRLFGRRP